MALNNFANWRNAFAGVDVNSKHNGTTNICCGTSCGMGGIDPMRPNNGFSTNICCGTSCGMGGIDPMRPLVSISATCDLKGN